MSTALHDDGRKVVRFGDVVTCVNNTTRNPTEDGLDRVVGLDHMDPDSLPLRRWDCLGDLPDGTSFTRRFKAGQVLFGKRRAYQRKVSVPQFDGICSGDILVFEVSGAEMLQEFLPYVVQSAGFFEHALDTSAGSLSPRTKWQDLAKYEFNLPSLDEQRELIQEQHLVETCRDLAVDCMNRLTDLELSLRAAMFVSDCGPVIPIAEVSLIPSQNGLSVPKSERGGAIPMINMGALFTEDIKINGNSAEPVSLNAKVLSRYLLATGDLLFARRSIVLAGAGRCVVVGPLDQPTVFESSIIRVRVDESVLRPSFLLHYFHSPRGRAQMRTIVRRGAVSGIAGSDLRRLEVPIPPLEIQEAFLRPFPAIEEVRSRFSSHLQAYGPLQTNLREVRLNGGTDAIH